MHLRQKTAASWFGENVARSVFREDHSIDPSRHFQLRNLIPQGKIAVAESGIHSPEELTDIAAHSFDAALIGTALLKGPEKIAKVAERFSCAAMKIRRRRDRNPSALHGAHAAVA